MLNNPIVDEVHRVREQLLARYNGDLRALIEDSRRRTEEAAKMGRQVLPYSPPHPETPAIPAKKAV